MIAAIAIGLRASVVLLVALAAAALLRRRSASLRHWVLAAGIFLAATVAPLGYVLPSWDVPNGYVQAFDRLATAGPAPSLPAPVDSIATAPLKPPATRTRMSIEEAVDLAWALGSLIVLAGVIYRLVWIAQVTRRATPITDHRWQSSVAVLKTATAGIVGTWGWRRPCVLVPIDCESWHDDRIRSVLAHELAHIHRRDWMIQISSEIVRAVFWYNPLFWIACARLRRESEHAADDIVLEGGVPAADYATHLLDLARTYRKPVSALVLPVARPSTLEWRIAAMLNASLIRRRPTRRALAIACAVIAAVTLSASSFRAAAVMQPMPLTGTIYDMTGGVLPAVAVTLENETGMHLTTSTDRNGRFDFGVIDPGKYTLASEIIGFLAMKQNISLSDERDFNRSITMQVGTLQESITVTEQRRAGTVPAPVQLHIGGNLKAPTKVKDVRPVYPPSMRDAGIDGVVPLGAVIGVDGRVLSVRGISASAHPELTQAAMEAVRQWVFTPTLLNGQPVEVFMTVSVTFSLQD